jgi:carbonic anhydrase
MDTGGTVTKRLSAASVSQQNAIPYAFLNSTIAMMLTFAGFVVHDLLIARGVVGFNSVVCFTSIIFSLSLVYLWPRLKAFKQLERVLFVFMAVQWFWVAYAIGGLYFSDYHVAPTVFAICASVVILKIARERHNKWLSTAAFSFFGTAAMGLTIWQGLDDWSISASAKFRDTLGQYPQKFSKTLGSDGTNSSQEAGATIRNWSYEGETGPAMWGQLKPEFKQCASGANQSPIDIPRHAFLTRRWANNHWKSESGIVVIDEKSLRIDLSGKTHVEVDKKYYRVKQLHMRSPSEHQLSGLSYPMEIQLILESSGGDVLALASFVEIGEENPEFGKIIEKSQSPVKVGLDSVDNLKLSSFFPDDFSAYRYSGSLTVPPCTEGFSWAILRKPIEFSAGQVEAFRKKMPINARPIQPFGGRKFEVVPVTIAH